MGSRGESRVEGQNNLEYIFTSIVNPDAYVVEGFDDNLMPENWQDIYSEDDIYDIMAYLLTLGDAGSTAAPAETSDTSETTDTTDSTEEQPAETADTVDTSVIPVELLEGADAENGMALFTTFQADAGFACSTCHRTDTEDRLIGPGQLNIGSRAETRVEGQSAVEYIYTSIVNPDAFIVPDYTADLMPENWVDIYSDEEIFDIIAYMLTLSDEGSADDADAEDIHN